MPYYIDLRKTTQIARFMGPTWDPPGAGRTQVGSCWPHELCYQGVDVTSYPCHTLVKECNRPQCISSFQSPAHPDPDKRYMVYAFLQTLLIVLSSPYCNSPVSQWFYSPSGEQPEQQNALSKTHISLQVNWHFDSLCHRLQVSYINLSN